MKKIIVLIASLFIITGCGDGSSGKSTTTRNGNLNRGGTGSLSNGGCVSLDCGSNSNNGSNPFSGNTTTTPFAVGITNSSFYSMRIGLEFYADNPSSVEALGEMEVVRSNYSPNHCQLPAGYYDIYTINAGAIGTNGVLNSDHEYSGMIVEGDGPATFRARVNHSLANNRGDLWDLRAYLELLSVEGFSCNQYGNVYLNFNFPL